MTDPRTTISVVIPVHNEADYLPGALADLFSELDTVPADVTVLVAENGSTDTTADAVRRAMDDYPRLDLLELDQPDYGAAMRAGFLRSRGDWVVNFDIDYFSGDFLRSVVGQPADVDIVLASKRAEGADDKRGWFRRFATWTFNQILRYGLSSGVSDTHGMKALRGRVIADVAPQVRSTQDLFDTELIVRAERAGYRIVEVPAKVEEKRATNAGLVTRVPRTLRGIWSIRKNLRH